MYCSTEDMPALAFYIQGSAVTCTYVIYHIVIAWVAAFLILAWFIIAKIAPRPNNYSDPTLLYLFISLLFGIEIAAIYLIVLGTMTPHKNPKENTAPSAPPMELVVQRSPEPTAPPWPRIEQRDIFTDGNSSDPPRNFP